MPKIAIFSFVTSSPRNSAAPVVTCDTPDSSVQQGGLWCVTAELFEMLQYPHMTPEENGGGAITTYHKEHWKRGLNTMLHWKFLLNFIKIRRVIGMEYIISYEFSINSIEFVWPAMISCMNIIDNTIMTKVVQNKWFLHTKKWAYGGNGLALLITKHRDVTFQVVWESSSHWMRWAGVAQHNQIVLFSMFPCNYWKCYNQLNVLPHHFDKVCPLLIQSLISNCLVINQFMNWFWLVTLSIIIIIIIIITRHVVPSRKQPVHYLLQTDELSPHRSW